jgi:hypothetical protein
MAEGLVSRIIVSPEAQSQILDNAEHKVVYAYELIDGGRKLILFTREEGDETKTYKAAYNYLTYNWMGYGFLQNEYAWCVVSHEQYHPIPNANQLVSTQFFGPDFFDFVINSDNYELRLIYNGFKQLMEVDPSMYM